MATPSRPAPRGRRPIRWKPPWPSSRRTVLPEVADDGARAPEPADEAPGRTPVLTRRALLGTAAVGTAGFVVGRIVGPFDDGAPSIAAVPATSAVASAPPTAAASIAPESSTAPIVTHPFFGPHQAGVTTPPQRSLYLAAFDMADGTDRRDLERLLRDWSTVAERLARGESASEAGAFGGDPASPPDDTGEAADLAAGGLTVTIGFGPRLFDHDGTDPYGLAAVRPRDLQPLPAFGTDALDDARSHGELCLQACADDPQVALHAVRNLARVAGDRVTMRWSQTGYRESTEPTGPAWVHRNLLGFRDGIANLRAADQRAIDEHVWVPPSAGPAWLVGGTYLVVRKIRLLVEDWDDQPLAEQEAIIGRTKDVGAPLSGGSPAAELDLDAIIDGVHAIRPAAHVRLAHQSNHRGIRILRRGYSYVDGTDPDGLIDAGLMFLAFQRSPERFVEVQRGLAHDELNEYLRTVASAVFAVPPGVPEGGFIGEGLFRAS